MPSPSDVQAFDGYTLGVGFLSDVTAYIEHDGTEDPKADVQHLERPGQTAEFVQATVQPGLILVKFQYQNSYAAKAAILRVLDFPHNKEERVIRAWMGDDTDPTLCEGKVSVQDVKQEPGLISATFVKADPYWQAVDATNLTDLSATITFSDDGAWVMQNDGHVRAQPTYRVWWVTQRTVFTAAIGWRYRRQVTIENDGDEDWHDEPIPLDLGDTAAWVTASKAESDGDDVRVWIEGRDVPRTLVNMNTKRTFAWVLISLPSGESITLDVVYGNSAAGAGVNLSTRTREDQTYVAFDLEGTNGVADIFSTTTIGLTGAGWETDRWVGGFIYMTNSGGTIIRARRIASNTSTTITFNRALGSSSSSIPNFVVWMSGVFADGGRVTTTGASSIVDNAHTEKWGVNQLAGATVTFLTGSSASPATMTVLSNTTDTLTFTSSFSVQPTVADSYTIDRLGVQSYVVDTALTETAHRDLYRINRYHSPGPSRTWANGDTPGGWQVTTYLPNDDDYAHFKPFDTGSGGGHSQNWRPGLRPRRRVGQDRRYKNEGNGDGLSIYSPFRFQGIYFDWRVKNVNGVGRAVFAAMEPGGESWVDIYTYSSTHAGLTDVAARYEDLSGFDDRPSRLYMGVLPATVSDDDANIPSTAGVDDEIELRTNNRLQLYLDLSAFGGLSGSRYVVGSEAEIYDLNVALRLGGGNDTDKTPPYDLIQIGGTGHKIGITADEELWITTDPTIGRSIFAVFNQLSSSITRAVAWAGEIYRYRLDIDGNEVALQAMEFAPLPPATNMIDNGDFATNDVSMWTMTLGSGVTATKTWVTTPSVDVDSDGDPRGSMQIDITVTPVGAWDITLTLPTISVIPNRVYPFGFWRQTDDNGNSVAAELIAVWGGGVSGDADQTLGGAFTSTGVWYHDADSNLTWYLPPGMVSPFSSVDTVDFIITISGSGSYTGKVFIDLVTLGIPTIHLTETNMGALGFDAVWVKRMLS